jgi:hypothetical protein
MAGGEGVRRREFLGLLGIATGSVLIPQRKIFLPPRPLATIDNGVRYSNGNPWVALDIATKDSLTSYTVWDRFTGTVLDQGVLDDAALFDHLDVVRSRYPIDVPRIELMT